MSDPAPKAIFLSYARDDAASARRIAEALRSTGLEVWFDENELRGGDTWDAKIRKQIDECALFVAVISKNTEERAKGYFRLEWKLAVDQTHLLAEGVPFIAPVVIDDTRENGASVPAEFLRVQWTRLPGALPTPQFVEQVKRLLDAPKKSAATTRSADASVSSASARGGIPPWVWAAVVVVIGGGVMFFVQRPSVKEPMSPAASAKSAAAPASEARQLVAKARALYEPWDLAAPEDFALADQLLKKATDLDPSDGDAWAAYALLSCGEIVMSLDNSDERMAAARIQGERAVKLAPDSNAARFAHAFSLRFNRQTQDECLRLLREEAARQPTNRMVVRTLGTTLRAFGETEQALLYLDKAAAIPGNDPVTQYNRAQALRSLGRTVESEAALDEALAIMPSYRAALIGKITYLLNVHDDLAAARSRLEKAPPAYFATDAGAALAARIALYSRDGGKCIEALQPIRDYISAGIGFSGPKAYLTGMAQRLMGNEDAAKTDWRAALRVVEQRLVSRPNDYDLLWWRAALLGLLDRGADMEPLLREIRQRVDVGERNAYDNDAAEILLCAGKLDEAIASLEALHASHRLNGRSSLRYDPLWDPIRSNPRFEALFKKPEPRK